MRPCVEWQLFFFPDKDDRNFIYGNIVSLCNGLQKIGFVCQSLYIQMSEIFT